MSHSQGRVGDHSNSDMIGVFVGVVFRMGDMGMWMFQSG